jgi:hypothetical protein
MTPLWNTRDLYSPAIQPQCLTYPLDVPDDDLGCLLRIGFDGKSGSNNVIEALGERLDYIQAGGQLF